MLISEAMPASDAVSEVAPEKPEVLARCREPNAYVDSNHPEIVQYAAEHGPYPFATLEQTLDHFDHVVALTGSVDHVGIGSDYDGVGDSLPIGLKDVSSYPNLVRGLLERGYSDEDIRKILGGNVLRVWRAVEAAEEFERSVDEVYVGR